MQGQLQVKIAQGLDGCRYGLTLLPEEPDVWYLAGLVICLIGSAVILFAPRTA